MGRGISETSAPGCTAAPERGSLRFLHAPLRTLQPLLGRAQAPTCAESVTWIPSRSATRASLGSPWPTATGRPRAFRLPSAGGGGHCAPAPVGLSLCTAVRMVRCLVPLLPVLPVCLVTVQLLSPCSADFAVLGPPEPILAMVGEDTHLPCHLSPKMNAETMDLMWERPSLRQVVHTYAHGQEDTPAEEYRGRTSVLREDVTAGKAALQIRNVTASDNGTYLCYFQDRDFSAEAQVELQVAAMGSDPHIKMKGNKAGGVRVTCTSAGWYPPPQIEWRDARGQRISDEVGTEAADPQGLYAASASVVLEEGSGEGVSCVIRNPLLGQERSAWFSIPGPFFRNAEPQMAFIAPFLLVPAVLLPVVLCLRWRRQRRNQAPYQEVEKPRGWTRRAGADHGSAPDLHLSLCSCHEQDLLRIRAGGSQKSLEDVHEAGGTGGERHHHLTVHSAWNAVPVHPQSLPLKLLGTSHL